MSNFLTFMLLALLVPHAHADCECGYTVNSTLYTDLLETDFLHLPNITLDTDWQPQKYTVTAADARGPYGKNASLGNVVANPLKDNNSWTGEGILGGDPGLQLWVRGGIPQDGLIPIAEVASTREDMLYGSFRASMKLTGTPGTCGAFFWYYNNSQEIDLEFLSRQFADTTTYPVNLVLQSPISALSNSAATTPTFTLHPLPFSPTASYHEYRFDWSPTLVSFYADSLLLATMNASIPTQPGSVHLSHWSNGDGGWSAGPPAEDAVVTVGYVKGYFNSSREERVRDWRGRCKDGGGAGGGVNATCKVPDQVGTPGPGGTWFFSAQPNMTGNQTVFGGKKSEGVGRATGMGEWGVGLGGLVLAVMMMVVGVGWMGEMVV